MGKLIKEQKEKILGQNPIMAEIIAFIEQEKKRGRFLESIILSKFDYARLEKYLISINILNEDTYGLPIDYRGVELKEGSSNVMDALPEYKKLNNAPQQLKNLEENEEIFKLTNYKALDQAFNKIKKK